MLRYWILIRKLFKCAQQIWTHLHFKRIKISLISDVFDKGDFLYIYIYIYLKRLKRLYTSVFDTVCCHSIECLSSLFFFFFYFLIPFFSLVGGNFVIFLSSLKTWFLTDSHRINLTLFSIIV